MCNLPKVMEARHYKKYKGKVYINTLTGDLIKLKKIITRTRNSTPRTSYYFAIIKRTVNDLTNYTHYQCLNWRYNSKTLENLVEISLEDVNSVTDDVKVLYS